mmetsp:Transcript_73159/g.145108  ORF Transcript_73159/g.145108 Transcript_73159/m.145108 type:complete len:335 (+) Transcript_73159:17-1021(+)
MSIHAVSDDGPVEVSQHVQHPPDSVKLASDSRYSLEAVSLDSASLHPHAAAQVEATVPCDAKHGEATEEVTFLPDEATGTAENDMDHEHDLRALALQQSREPTQELKVTETDDLVELALLARLKSRGTTDGERDCNLEQAADNILWALDAAKRMPPGIGELPPLCPWGSIACLCCFCVVIPVLLSILATLTRLYFQEVTVRDGILLASGIPAYSGDEPVAATAAAVESRNLEACLQLPAESLQRLLSVVFVHRDAWWSLRVARVLRFSDSHLMLEAPDGTAVRLLRDEAFFRDGALGDEEQLLLQSETLGPERVRPTAFFSIEAVESEGPSKPH